MSLLIIWSKLLAMSSFENSTSHNTFHVNKKSSTPNVLTDVKKTEVK